MVQYSMGMNREGESRMMQLRNESLVGSNQVTMLSGDTNLEARAVLGRPMFTSGDMVHGDSFSISIGLTHQGNA